MGIKIYLLFLVVSDVISGLSLMMTNKYSAETIIISILVTWFGYWFCYKIYRILCKKSPYGQKFSFDVRHKRLDYFVTVYLVVMIFYSMRTGDGAAETASLFSSSIFASLWNTDALFPFYYWINRKTDSKHIYLNMGIYSIYKILLGWTGVLLSLFFFEIFYRLKDKKFNLIKVTEIIVGTYIGGGFVYSFMYPLKYSIRFGTAYNFNLRLPLADGLQKLSARVSHINITAYVHENIQAVSKAYLNQGVSLIEFKAAFRPLIPSSIFKDKIFSSIGSCIHNTMSGYYTGINITGNCGILEYYRLMIHCDVLDLILCVLYTIIMLATIKYICNCFRETADQFAPLLFWIMLAEYSICGTIENSLSGHYFKIIFFLPLFIILGIIRVKNTTSYYTQKEARLL